MKHTLYGQYVFLQVLWLNTKCNVALAPDGTSTEGERWIPGRVWKTSRTLGVTAKSSNKGTKRTWEYGNWVWFDKGEVG